MFNYKEYNERKYKENFWTINRSKYKWFSNYVKLKIFKKEASKVKNKKVFLDAGGGVGNWAFHFLKSFEKVIVLDISERALKQIPEKEIIKKQGSVIKIPLESESVNCILLSDVFEHVIPNDLDKMLTELKRVLKKDGKIIIFTSQYGYGIRLILNRVFGRMQRKNKSLMKLEEKEGHLNRLKFNTIKRLIKNNGLEIENYYHYSIFFQQLTDFMKDESSKIIDKIIGGKAQREGQVIKDKLKRIEKPGFLFQLVFGTLSFLSYLDIILFGKLIPGESIFLILRKQ